MNIVVKEEDLVYDLIRACDAVLIDRQAFNEWPAELMQEIVAQPPVGIQWMSLQMLQIRLDRLRAFRMLMEIKGRVSITDEG